MLYTLNIYFCQLFLNKAGGNKRNADYQANLKSTESESTF